MATEALAVVTAVTEEEGSEVGGVILAETVAVVTAPGVAVALATTEEDTNAASAKRLITEVPTCGDLVHTFDQ